MARREFVMRSRGWPLVWGLMGLALALILSSCGDLGSDSIGEPCGAHSDCPGSARCLVGDEFPRGLCSIACDSHSDCPYFAYCADLRGGICLLRCEESEDCRSSYECSEQKNYGSHGQSLMCIGE